MLERERCISYANEVRNLTPNEMLPLKGQFLLRSYLANHDSSCKRHRKKSQFTFKSNLPLKQFYIETAILHQS